MAFISNEEINAIRSKADIVSIIGSYIPLTQKGKNFIGVCPFHEDHSPSMSVSQEKQIYKCFACGATGNVFTFVSEYENIPFIDAVAVVANKCGMELSLSSYQDNASKENKEEYEIMDLAQKFFQNNLRTTAGAEALKYLNERGLNEDVIKEFGIGLSLDSVDALNTLLLKKNYDANKITDIHLANNVNGKLYDMFSRRITFPLWDKDGKIVGFSARVYRGEKDVSKYMNSKESIIFKKGETLYNYHNAKDVARREKEIIVVEGFMDAIRISSNGIKNVVALCGTALTKNQINLLKKLRCKVILCLDNDSAGELATVNNGLELVNSGVETYVIRLSGEKDPDEYIISKGIEAFKDNVKNPLTYFDFKISYLKADKDLNSVTGSKEFVYAVLHDLANSDDLILREATLNKLSEQYNYSKDILQKELDNLNPVAHKKEEVVEEPPPSNIKIRNSYVQGSEKILYCMMNGPEYIKEYQVKLGFFSDPIYREIANEIVYYYETNKEITVADFITYASLKEDIKEEVMNIVNYSGNEEITIQTMDNNIDAVLSYYKKKEIKRLRALLKKELDVDKQMKLCEQIAELKKEDV